MNALSETRIDCPYCGESISVLIEPASEELEYVEDCQVCCRPIVFSLRAAWDGDSQLFVRTENDTF